MISNLHSLTRSAFFLVAWRVAPAHAGPPSPEEVGLNTRPYLDASPAVNPGRVNQKRPAGSQYDTPEDYLGAEAHSTPFHWLDRSTGDHGTFAVRK
jgi:hypothetical protein